MNPLMVPLAFASVALALFAVDSPVHAQTAPQPLPRFEPGPCAVDLSAVTRKVDCGVLVVAENRAKPNGRTVAIPVAIARATAAASDRKADPVIYLHGGPGGASIRSLPFLLRDPRPRADGSPAPAPLVTPDRDWIFFDQRGTGLGQPNLDCGNVQLTDSGLVSDADIAAMTACHQRLKAASIDLSQYNSEVIAADIADMRKTLGFDRFNLLGGSYGSRIAFAVQQYHPEGLRTSIHDSPYPPEAKGTEDLPVLVARETRKVLAKCEADPTCKAKFGGLEPKLTAMASAWAAQPKVVDGRTYTVEDLASFLLDSLYSWDGARRLPLNITAILEGRMDSLDAYMANRSTYQEGQNFTHFCKEELPFESATAMREKAGTDPLARAIVTTATRYFEGCKAWDVGPANPREIEPVRSAVPTLILASEIDAGCPGDFAVAALPFLSRGVYVEVPNQTHVSSSRSVCARAMIHAFLADPSKAPDRTCLPVEHARFPFILAEGPTR